MKKICLIGDSHSACFRMAWNDLQRKHPDVVLTFFADRGVKLTELQPEKQGLVPQTERLRQVLEHTSGGLSTINFPSYDAVYLVGMLWAYPRQEGHFSRAVVRQALTDYVPTSVGFDLIQKIRQVSPIPVYVSHAPLLAVEGAPDAETDIEPYRDVIEFINGKALVKPDVVVLEQPLQTVTNRFFTKLAYSDGSTRLDVGDKFSGLEHPNHDRTHMNQKFGVASLGAHLPIIAA